MDLTELHHHADTHGKWTMQLSANESLTCELIESNKRAVWGYNYLYRTPADLIPITEQQAEDLINRALAKAVA